MMSAATTASNIEAESGRSLRLIPRPLFPTRPRLQAALDRLHQISLQQEIEGSHAGKFYPDKPDEPAQKSEFVEKLVALEQDKASAMYLILRSINAQRVFEAGTSYGVSTMYLLAAVRDNLHTYGPLPRPFPSRVWGTEHEPAKAARATEHIREAFADNGEIEEIENGEQVKILIGDLLQTIKEEGIEENSVDALLLDIWADVALPTLELLTPALRTGALLFVDNAISSAPRYAKLNAFLRSPENGWQSVILPFTNGFEMAVKTGV